MNALLLRLSALLLVTPGAFAGILYVDANLTTGLSNGSSWANAYRSPDGLRLAIAASVAGDQIFVAQGTYTPTQTGSRTQAFFLRSGVEIYGGFLGTESSVAERPPLGTAPSILSGDLGGNDPIISDNSYHVINGAGANPTGILDGFTVTGGNANFGNPNDRGGGILCIGGTSPTIRNCVFEGNRCNFGGGAGYINNSAPTFINTVFRNNNGGAFGGAFDIAGAGAVTFDRCLFEGNSAARAGGLEIFASNGVRVSNSVFRDNTATGSNGGGGLWIGNGGSTLIRNCTVVDNTATVQTAAGLRVQGSSVTVANSIFWDNTGPGGAQNAANQINGTSAVTYSIVEGGFAGTGNVNSDPQFEDPLTGNFALQLTSPGIDAGNNGAVLAGILLDFLGNPRFSEVPSVPNTGAGSAPIVDIGAYEYQGAIGMSDPACSPTNNTTGGPATLSASGSLAVSDNDLTLLAASLPTSEFGYFLMSESSSSAPVASGVLCLGAPQYRFSNNVLNSGAAGEMTFSPDLGNLPQNQAFSPGETWYFQLWYRDSGSSNFSESRCFTWQ